MKIHWCLLTKYGRMNGRTTDGQTYDWRTDRRETIISSHYRVAVCKKIKIKNKRNKQQNKTTTNKTKTKVTTTKQNKTKQNKQKKTKKKTKQNKKKKNNNNPSKCRLLMIWHSMLISNTYLRWYWERTSQLRLCYDHKQKQIFFMSRWCFQAFNWKS